MRATVRDFKHVFLGCTWAAAAAVGTAACADALHLSPAGTGGGGTSTSTSTSSGGVSCHSALECKYPTPVCDPAGDVCVECASSADCAGQPGTVCSKGKCGCLPGGDAGALTYCADAPGCIDTQTSQADCGSCGHACFGNCAAGACVDAWEPLPTDGAPDPRSHHVAVWTGTQMFVWGGGQRSGGATVYLDTGGLYDPVARAWTPTSLSNAPSPRQDATAVFDVTGNVVIVWGGTGEAGVLGDGATYNPTTNVWTPMSANGAPVARTNHTAVWADSNGMIVFGGDDGAGTYFGDTFSYAPGTDVWGELPTGGPLARSGHSAVWDGVQMDVFGGFGATAPAPAPNAYLGDAWAYAPVSMWVQSTGGALPSARGGHTATLDSTGSTASVIVFGGVDAADPQGLQTGASLDVATMTWATLQSSSAGIFPDARSGHTAVDIVAPGATAGTVYVFGGNQMPGAFLGTGGVLDVASATWTSLLPTGPSPRSHHTAVATGTTMIVWGGDTNAGPTNTGAVLDPTKLP